MKEIFKLRITFTNLIGALAFLRCIELEYDLGAILAAILVLGRAALPVLVSLAKAVKGIKEEPQG